MLKRPAEVQWNFRKPPEPFPQTPGANGCFLAPSGGGKTTTLISMLLGPYRGIFDEVHVFSPSVHIDSAWTPVKQFAGHLENSSFNDEWDEEKLRQILDRQRDRIRQLKDAKSKKPLPQILTVIDDYADRSDILHSRSGILTTLFIRGRHFGSSCWVSSQKLTAIASVARVNFRFLLVWRLRNQKEILALMEELSAIYPISVLREMYETAITDEDHSFMFIDLVAKRKEDMFFIRFDQKLVLE
jgi:hypothetical protein